MDMDQLRQFLFLAKTENMREAAERLYISQPTLSRNLKELEAELGYPLFERNKQRIILNRNGKEARIYIQKIFDELEKLHQINMRSSDRIPLNFIGKGSVYYDVLVPMLTKEVPWYEISCITCSSNDDYLQTVHSKENAIVFAAVPETQELEAAFEHQLLLKDRLCISVPTKYQLALRSSIHINELEDVLRGLPVVLSNHIESNYSNAVLYKHNIQLRPSYTVNQPINSLQLIGNDGIVFDSYLLSYFPRTSSRKFIPIEGDGTSFDVHICYRKTEQTYTNYAIEWLLDFFREMNK